MSNEQVHLAPLVASSPTYGSSDTSDANGISDTSDARDTNDISDTHEEENKYGEDWVKNTFKKKICIYCVRNENNPDNCLCGRRIIDHKDASGNQLNVHEGTKWNPETHTEEINTNAYGRIVSSESRPLMFWTKFLRLTPSSSINDIKTFLKETLRVDGGDIFISIAGTKEGCEKIDGFQQNFINGFKKILASTSVWLNVAGDVDELMSFIEPARNVEQEKNLLLSKYSIATTTLAWDNVYNRKNLTNTPSMQLPDCVAYNKLGKQELDQELDCCFLIDKGDIHESRQIIHDFQSKLERCFLDHVSKKAGVQLIIGGSLEVLKLACCSLTNTPAIPIVVFKETGGVAELIAFVKSIKFDGKLIKDSSDLEDCETLSKMVKVLFRNDTRKIKEEVFKSLLSITRYSYLITVCSLNRNDNINGCILEALTVAMPTDELASKAVFWDCFDFVKDHLQEISTPILHKLMTIALVYNKTKFVQYFLQEVFTIDKYLDLARLETLYNSIRENYDYRKLIFLKLVKTNKNLIEYEKNVLMQQLKLMEVDKIIQKLIGNDFVHFNLKLFMYEVPLRAQREALYAQLLVWSIFFNMPDMTMVLWKLSPRKISTGILATKLYEEIANVAEQEFGIRNSLIDEMRENSNIFKDLTIKLLDSCFRDNNIWAEKLIKDDYIKYGGSCTKIASKFNFKEFIAHSCCQDMLNKKWTGSLLPQSFMYIKVPVCFFFPPIILLLPFKQRSIHNSSLTSNVYDWFADWYNANKKTYNELEELKNQDASGEQVENHEINLLKQEMEFKAHYKERAEIFERGKMEKIVDFYRAPVTSFWMNSIVQLLYTILLISFVTTKLENSPTSVEILLLVFTISFACEEIRQAIEPTMFRQSLSSRLNSWFTDKWNLLDMLAIICFFVAYGLRCYESTIIAAQVIYALDTGFWIIRLLSIFAYHPIIGPYLIMIKKMTIDLAYFVFILLVFLVAYAVARYALLHPNQPRSWKTFGRSFLISYFHIYGELFIDYPFAEGNSTIFSTPDEGYSHIEPLVIIILVAYFIVANLLLLNIIIAVFNNTYTEVQSQSNMLWRYQWYELVREYSIKSFLPPPLNLLRNLYGVLVVACDKSYLLWNDCFVSGYYQMPDENWENDHAEKVMEEFNTSTPDIKSMSSEEDKSNDLVLIKELKTQNANVTAQIADLKQQIGSMNNLVDESNYGMFGPQVTVENFINNDRQVNQLSRSKYYAFTNIKRRIVPEDSVLWEVDMDDYNPPTYCHKLVALFPRENEDASSRNPLGRTGIQGFGLLTNYGANNVIRAIITRTVTLGSHSVVEFFLVDGAIFFEYDVESNLLKELADLCRRVTEDKSMEKQNKNFDLYQSFTKQPESALFDGCIDSPMNTDNAWINLQIFQHHDEDDIVDDILAYDEDRMKDCKWVSMVDIALKLTIPEIDIMKKVIQ